MRWDRSDWFRLHPRLFAAGFPGKTLSGLEILGHAIEYLADEYAVDPADKGPLGNSDPRIAAIQTLKALNRAIYFSAAKVQPLWQRIRHWLLPSTMSNLGRGNGQ